MVNMTVICLGHIRHVVVGAMNIIKLIFFTLFSHCFYTGHKHQILDMTLYVLLLAV